MPMVSVIGVCLGGVSPEGCLPMGVSAGGGVCLLVCVSDRCKNITLPQLHCRRKKCISIFNRPRGNTKLIYFENCTPLIEKTDVFHS